MPTCPARLPCGSRSVRAARCPAAATLGARLRAGRLRAGREGASVSGSAGSARAPVPGAPLGPVGFGWALPVRERFRRGAPAGCARRCARGSSRRRQRDLRSGWSCCMPLLARERWRRPETTRTGSLTRRSPASSRGRGTGLCRSCGAGRRVGSHGSPAAPQPGRMRGKSVDAENGPIAPKDSEQSAPRQCGH